MDDNKPVEMELVSCSKQEGLRQLADPKSDAFLVIIDESEGPVVYSSMPPEILEKLMKLLAAEINRWPIEIKFRNRLN
jgi:hypothetical protein